MLHSAKGEPSLGILSCFQRHRSTDSSVIPSKTCPPPSCSGKWGAGVGAAGTVTLQMLPWGQAGGITHRADDGLITDSLISALLIFSQRPFDPSPDKWWLRKITIWFCSSQHSGHSMVFTWRRRSTCGITAPETAQPFNQLLLEKQLRLIPVKTVFLLPVLAVKHKHKHSVG